MQTAPHGETTSCGCTQAAPRPLPPPWPHLWQPCRCGIQKTSHSRVERGRLMLSNLAACRL